MKAFGKELKLLICDVDGVLLDLMACFPKNFCDAAREFGVSDEPIKQYLRDVGLGLTQGYASLSKCISTLYPRLSEIEVQKFKKIFHKKDEKNPYPPVSGSRILIRKISESIPVALCTTKGFLDLKNHLEYAKFKMNWFSYISSWETGHPKPNPRALTIITDSLKIPKENALFVGDWYPDLVVARGGGVRFIAVLSGGIPRHAFVREGVPDDHIIERLVDLPKLITE